MSIQKAKYVVGVTALIFSGVVVGQTTVPNDFTAGQPARAAEVNENFDTLETAIDQNASDIQSIPAGPQGDVGPPGPQGNAGPQGPIGPAGADLSNEVSILQGEQVVQNDRIAALEAAVLALQTTVTSLQTQVDAVTNNSVLDLDGVLTQEPDGTARFNGVNVQITASGRNTGNLILGFNDLRPNDDPPECSNGIYRDGTTCTAAGELWATNHRTGRHNIIIGDRNNYTTDGGIVAGYDNSIMALDRKAFAIGGEFNLAAGMNAMVVGGIANFASGEDSVVVGGLLNVASGVESTATGGNQNEASGITSLAAGGVNNAAQGINDSAVGGQNNLSTGRGSVVVGGSSNVASGDTSLVTGGSTNRAEFISSSVTGGWRNVASGSGATVSGGSDRTASGDADWVAGALFQDN